MRRLEVAEHTGRELLNALEERPDRSLRQLIGADPTWSPNKTTALSERARSRSGIGLLYPLAHRLRIGFDRPLVGLPEAAVPAMQQLAHALLGEGHPQTIVRPVRRPCGGSTTSRPAQDHRARSPRSTRQGPRPPKSTACSAHRPVGLVSPNPSRPRRRYRSAPSNSGPNRARPRTPAPPQRCSCRPGPRPSPTSAASPTATVRACACPPSDHRPQQPHAMINQYVSEQ